MTLQALWRCALLLAIFSIVLLTLGLSPVRAGDAPLAGKRVLFLGDSITQNGQYVSFIEYYLDKLYPAENFDFISIGLASETVSGLSEKAHPFPRPYLHNRLQAALDAVKPSIVVACYGMNDGIYHPQSPDRMVAFQTGIRLLISKVKASGARLVLLTPPPFDPIPVSSSVRPPGAPDYSFMNPYVQYNDVLADYARWEMTLPLSDARVIDLHTPLSKFLADQRRADPNYKFSPDGIHPPPIGHLLMAQAVLTGLGVPMHSADPEAELNTVTSDPLYVLVAAHRQGRSDGWLSYVGYTRGDTVKTDSIASTEEEATEQQKEIDQMRRGVSSGAASQSSIIWGDPIPTRSVRQIDTRGVLVHAGRWGGPTISVAVGGKEIVFASRTINSTGSSEDLATASGQGGYTGGFLSSTGNLSFDKVLNSFAYNGPNPRVVELRGLRAGHQYEVQLFALDDRDLVPADHRPGTRAVRYGDKPNFSGSNSKAFLMRDNASVIGRFTASGPLIFIYQDEMNPLDHSGNINAYVLRDVTKL